MSDLRKYVSIRPTTLSSGVNVGSTTCIPSQIKDRLGNTISSMTSFGTKGFGVISPDTDKEEQFVFTGLSGGTVSGISAVTMQDPYTETSGWQKEHAAGEPIILYTNSPAFYNEFANTQNDNTFVGTQTFTESAMPRISASHTYGAGEEEYLATKRYVDGVVTGGAADANTTTKGLAEEATQAEIAAGTAAGGTSARLFTNPSTLAAHIQSGSWLFFTEDGTGSDDTYTASLTPALSAYTQGQTFVGKFTVANTGASTLNLNGLGAKVLKKYVAGAKADTETGDIVANQPVFLEYDGTDFVILTPTAALPTAANLQLVTNNIVDLTDGGETTLHSHAEKLPAYQQIKLSTNSSPSSTSDVMQFSLAPDLLTAYTTLERSTGTVDIERYIVNTKSKTVMRTSTVGLSSVGTDGAGITVGSTYVWVVAENSGGTDVVIRRYAKDLSGVTTITISGTAFTGGIRSVTGDDTTLYVKSKGSATQVVVYTISGTTATRGTDITLTGASADYPLLFDGTNFYQLTNTTLSKWSVSGGAATATLALQVCDSGSDVSNAAEASTRALIGITNVNSSEIAIALFEWLNEITDDRGYIHLMRADKI